MHFSLGGGTTFEKKTNLWFWGALGGSRGRPSLENGLRELVQRILSRPIPAFQNVIFW